MTSNTRKKYNCDICIGGLRVGAMKQIAKAAFHSSFISIEVKMPDRVFVIRLDNTVDVKKLEEFKEEYRLCHIIIYQPIDLSTLKTSKK